MWGGLLAKLDPVTMVSRIEKIRRCFQQQSVENISRTVTGQQTMQQFSELDSLVRHDMGAGWKASQHKNFNPAGP